MAFTIEVSDYIIRESLKFSLASKLGRRGDGSDGSESEQIVGVVGQNAVLHAMGYDLIQPSDKHDGGTDFVFAGLNIDIKTMGRNCPPKLNYINNFVASQSRLNADVYLFTSFNKKDFTLTICGYLPKQHLYLHPVYKKGDIRTRSDNTTFAMKADTYEILNSNLFYKFKTFYELSNQLIALNRPQSPSIALND